MLTTKPGHMVHSTHGPGSSKLDYKLKALILHISYNHIFSAVRKGKVSIYLYKSDATDM